MGRLHFLEMVHENSGSLIVERILCASLVYRPYRCYLPAASWGYFRYTAGRGDLYHEMAVTKRSISHSQRVLNGTLRKRLHDRISRLVWVDTVLAQPRLHALVIVNESGVVVKVDQSPPRGESLHPIVERRDLLDRLDLLAPGIL